MSDMNESLYIIYETRSYMILRRLQ